MNRSALVGLILALLVALGLYWLAPWSTPPADQPPRPTAAPVATMTPTLTLEVEVTATPLTGLPTETQAVAIVVSSPTTVPFEASPVPTAEPDVLPIPLPLFGLPPTVEGQRAPAQVPR